MGRVAQYFSRLSTIAIRISSTNVTGVNETNDRENGITLNLCHLPFLQISASMLVKYYASDNVKRNLMKVLDKVAFTRLGLYEPDIHGIDDMQAHLWTPITNAHGTMSIGHDRFDLSLW